MGRYTNSCDFLKMWFRRVDYLRFWPFWDYPTLYPRSKLITIKWGYFTLLWKPWYRLPFQWHSCNGKHLPAQIIYPRVYSQIRSEKSRSIRNAHRVAFEHGRQSEGKDMLQTH